MRSTTTIAGWAVRSLDAGLASGSYLGVAGIHLAVAGVALSSPTDMPPSVSVVLHLLVAILAVGSYAGRVPPLLMFALSNVSIVVDIAAAVEPNHPLVFVAVIDSVVVATPVLVIRERSTTLFCLVGAVAVSLGAAAVHPEWGSQLPIALATQAVTLIGVGLYFVRALVVFAVETDGLAAEAERAHLATVAARRASRHLAEDARILHDTIINTLGAIANGGAALGDLGAVRRRCDREAQTVDDLVGGRMQQHRVLSEILDQGGLPVLRSGIGEIELERLVALLPPETAQALWRAVEEVIRNARLHAHADRVEVDVRHEDNSLIVRVSDEGDGFAVLPTGRRGLTESVLGRARDNDFQALIESAVGRGTAVTFKCPLYRSHRPIDDVAQFDAERISRGVYRAGSRSWSVAIVVASAVTCLVSQGRAPNSTMASVAVIAAMWLLGAVAARGDRSLPAWLAAVIVAGTQVATVLAIAGIDFGRLSAAYWLPISLTPLLITLLVFGRTKIPVISAIVGMVVIGAISATVAFQAHHPVGAQIIGLGLAGQFGQFVAWVIFYRTVDVIARGSAAAQRDAAVNRAETAVRDSVSRAELRWRTATVRSALDLMRAIANGDADARDPSVQYACATEERHLRQLILLSPDLLYLSGWLAGALSAARMVSVHLTLRTGDTDASTEAVAAMIGEVVLGVIDMAAPHDSLTASLFETHGDLTLLLVGRRGFADVATLDERVLPGWIMRNYELDGQDLIVLERRA